jgi:AhpD family alkylhydroperoxidase
MAYIAYADSSAADTRDLVDRIVAERGSVLHLYQMLLHSPPLAEGWLTYLTAIRHKLSLPGSVRELIIMRVAVLNNARYEAEQHAPIALNEGLSRAQIDALSSWQLSKEFSAPQRAVLDLTDTMTREVRVPPAFIIEVRAHFDERQTVEIVATVAAYNMVSRFLEALHIRADDART